MPVPSIAPSHGRRPHREHGAAPAIPMDNAAMESFNAAYKRECVGLAEPAAATPPAPKLAMICLTSRKILQRVRRHSALGSNHLWTLNTNQLTITMPTTPQRCPSNRVSPQHGRQASTLTPESYRDQAPFTMSRPAVVLAKTECDAGFSVILAA